MKNFSKNFRENLREVREINTIISYYENDKYLILTTESEENLTTENSDFIVTQNLKNNLSGESIIRINPSFNVDLFKSVCKSLEAEIKNKIPINTKINVRVGVKVNGKYEYLDYGNYFVRECSYQADSQTYLIIAYDKMYQSMISYDDNDANITYPISIKNLLIKICNYLKWNYNFDTFVNQNKIINKDLFKGQGLTYRDILDNISQVIVGNLMFDGEDNLIVKYINNPSENDIEVNEYDLRNINVEITEKYGIVNALLITTNGNVVLNNKSDNTSIQKNGKTELKINDNYILINNSDDFINDMFDKINGLEYYIYDVDTIGILVLDPLDRFNIKINDTTYSTLMLNDDTQIDTGIIEKCYVDKPELNVSEYKPTNSIENKLNNAIINLDKANAEIVMKVTSDGKLAQVRLDGNTSDGSIFEIKSDNIKLEGYTTINGGFQVDLEGNVICNNAIIKGSEVVLSDNTEIIGGNGLLTNLQFQSTSVTWLNKLPGSYFLGYNYAYSTGAFKNWLEIDCIVPKGFKITEAYVNVYHTPVNWNGTRGYCRNLKLYKVLSPLNANINGAYLSEYEATYNYIENNTNALNFTANGTSSGEIATSSDIKNLLDVGFNKFTIHTSDSVPNVSADDNLNQKLGAYTGYCYAVLNIIGFKK